jgi:hypothetical protein
MQDDVDDQIWHVYNNRTIRFSILEHPVLTGSKEDQDMS